LKLNSSGNEGGRADHSNTTTISLLLLSRIRNKKKMFGQIVHAVPVFIPYNLIGFPYLLKMY
jgi:hypothetical protein